jgi:hypothetical protein
MKRRTKVVLVAVILAAWLTPLHAQYGANGEDQADDNSKINSNFGFTVPVPVSATADVISTGWGFTAGVGYNFNRRNAFVGEFMWNKVYPNTPQLDPLRAVLQGAGGLDGNTDLFVISGNYRFELRGKLMGVYLIGGPGWYHRNSNLSRTITTGTGITCAPVWFWWGFSCTSGLVTANQTLASSGASAWGVNGGGGVTVRVGEAPYRLYFEARYHYAPNSNINTQFVQVTVGIRY